VIFLVVSEALDQLKGQVNSLNILLFILLLGWFLRYMNRKKASNWVLIFSLLFFAAISTSYFPGYFIEKMETHYRPFSFTDYKHQQEKVYILSLGGGYTPEAKLEALGQLSLNSLGRLTEALRISRLLENSILVLSGYGKGGTRSLAWTERHAAFLLGFDTTRIILLEEPRTTREEVHAFFKKFGNKVNLILVTDAVHMPRAMSFFESDKVLPYPAPTNFLYKNRMDGVAWIPSIDNFFLMDRILREWFGQLKDSVSR